MAEKRNLLHLLMLVFVTALLFGLQVQEAKAAWGDLDLSFGSNGIYEDSVTDHYPASLLVQPDGKILVTGHRLTSTGKQRFFLRRYLSNGSPDTSFGNGGSAVINAFIAANGDYFGQRITLLSNGKIAVVGAGNGSLTIWQVNSNGYGDTGFGQGGMRVLFDYPANYDSVRIGTLGSRLIIGLDKTSIERIILIRLNIDGSLDTSFGNSGESLTSLTNVIGFEILTENDTKKITVAGHTVNTYEVALDRKLSTGANDSFFVTSSDGAFPASSIGGLVKQSTGKYIVQYTENPSTHGYHYLSRFNANGTPDTRFYYGNGIGVVRFVRIQQDSKVIAGGVHRYVRYNANLDSSSQESFSTYTELFWSLGYVRTAIQPDDKLVFVGRNSQGNLTLVRLLAN